MHHGLQYDMSSYQACMSPSHHICATAAGHCSMGCNLASLQLEAMGGRAALQRCLITRPVGLQVDFSQSVSHLWRHFKMRGNTADAAAGELAHSSGVTALPGNRGGGGGGCYTCGQSGECIDREHSNAMPSMQCLSFILTLPRIMGLLL